MYNLNVLKYKIENMPKIHQIEILRIFNNFNCNKNENKNGTFINLTELPKDVLNELYVYIEYYEKQQNNIDDIENEKIRLENTFFTKDI